MPKIQCLCKFFAESRPLCIYQTDNEVMVCKGKVRISVCGEPCKSLLDIRC